MSLLPPLVPHITIFLLSLSAVNRIQCCPLAPLIPLPRIVHLLNRTSTLACLAVRWIGADLGHLALELNSQVSGPVLFEALSQTPQAPPKGWPLRRLCFKCSMYVNITLVPPPLLTMSSIGSMWMPETLATFAPLHGRTYGLVLLVCMRRGSMALTSVQEDSLELMMHCSPTPCT